MMGFGLELKKHDNKMDVVQTTKWLVLLWLAKYDCLIY